MKNAFLPYWSIGGKVRVSGFSMNSNFDLRLASLLALEYESLMLLLKSFWVKVESYYLFNWDDKSSSSLSIYYNYSPLF